MVKITVRDTQTLCFDCTHRMVTGDGRDRFVGRKTGKQVRDFKLRVEAERLPKQATHRIHRDPFDLRTQRGWKILQEDILNAITDSQEKSVA